MGLFTGMAAADGVSRDPFFNSDRMYIIRINEHEYRATRNPTKSGSFFNIRCTVLESDDPKLPPGSTAIHMLTFKPAADAAMNIKVNGPALSNLREHVLVCLERKFALGGASEDDIRVAINELRPVPGDGEPNSPANKARAAALESLVEENCLKNKEFVGIDLVLNTVGIKTQSKGMDFTVHNYSAAVDEGRKNLAKRKEDVAA